MASVDLEYNSGFQIYNADGTKFHDLVLHKCTYETVVMSLGDNISGILYYKDNALDVTMSEYIIYKGVRYTLVNPPTILREGLVSDNSELRGMTKYSFTFYHPMYVLNNFPFSDIAVQSGQSRYLSQNKTFSWIGTLVDFVAKLNKNLEDTQWMVTIGNVTQDEQTKLSEVLSFDKNTIAEALKRGYETWEVPYVVDQLAPSSQYYPEKRFVVQYGLPTTEILDEYNQPFVFQMGQGVGLKNNSRNPKNNKIITRIAGYGSEDNIPYGYPQIPYYGGNVQYPLYYGIVGGQRVQLIKHPFTRNHLMPSVYSQSVYNKVNPKLSNGSNNPNYNPNIELVDYYDANDNTYPNRIKQNSPSYEIHEFGDIKPELGEKTIIRAVPVNQQETQSDYKQKSDFLQEILDRISATEIEDEKTELLDVYDRVNRGLSYYKKHGEEGGDTYWFIFSITNDDYYEYVSYESSNYNFTATVLRNGSSAPTPDWDDTMDDDGNYLQSYFKITLPTLEFDIYACAAITQEMKINMRSGACIGCTFPVEVDWDDYKRNFYNSDGEFAPNGQQRDYNKYPDSSSGQITVMVKKELETFGTLMPNQYQQPTTGDKFVILGISLPNTYITSAEQRLDTDMKQYMRDNNVYYFDYPLKFDEHFLINHEDILSQMKNNVVVRFNYAGTEHALYIKQMSVKYNESPLPKYDITLTDDIEIVLNQIGQVTDEVSKLRLGFGAGGFGTVGGEYIRKDIDDTARGTIRMIKGMQVGERFVTGLLGEGGVFRKDSDGTTYLETDKLYVRMKAYFDTVEVKHYLHTGGNRIASQASGIVCSRVEMIDANNNLVMNVANAVLFRCFFKANDGDKTIRNDFMIGDLAFCRETNVNVSEVNMHGYWRLVVGRNYDGFLTDNKEGWIDLSNRSSETLTIDGEQYVCNGYQNGSDAPIAQDDIIQLGNIADKDRQGAIVEYVGGEDAPSYQIFQGIGEDLPYPYTLEDKNYIGLGYSSQTGHAYMNVYGDMFIGAKPDPTTGESSTYIKYVQEDEETGEPRLKIKAEVEFIHSDGQGGTESTTMDDFIDAIKQSIEDIQDQIDGSIDTWYYEGVPTLNNEPAVNWTTPELKHEHIGDLYYDKANGNAYRFILDTSVTPNEYKWIQLHDDAITEALRLAAKAKDTADNKRRVFLTQPVPPYDQGDLWVNAVWPASGGHQGETYNNEILKCITAKTEGQAFSISDWSVANGYTAALNDFLTNTYAPFISNIQGQVDQKAETWYQNSNPATAWYDATQDPIYDVRAKHVGDIWMDTSENGGKQTYIYQYNTSTANYEWKAQAVPNEVFDYADGKCAIYVNNPTNTQNPYPTNYHEKDMWILPIDGTHDTYTIGGVEFKAGEVLFSSADSASFVAAHWTKKLRYTGDERIDGFINQILNGTGASGDDATVANAISSIKGALNEGTLIDGGLVLTSVLGLRSNSRVWAGISGMYNAAETGTGYKGHGIAAWYGGGMADWEVYYDSLTPTQQQRATITDAYAKSLFRFDGSGYLAGGNITWDKNGSIVIKNITTLSDSQNTNLLNELATFNSAFTFTTSGSGSTTVLSITPNVPFTALTILDTSVTPNVGRPVATQKWVNDNFMTIAAFERLFNAIDANGNKVSHPYSNAFASIKAMVGLWTNQYISAFGQNSSSGGGGSSTLAGLNDVTLSSPQAGQALVYRNSHWVNEFVSQSAIVSIGMTVPTGFLVSPSSLNNSGTFAISFGGSVAKNRVLAAPSDSAGAPSWRALVASDIPTLTASKISDIGISNSTITIGSNSITPLTDATLKSNYTWWGQTMNNNGAVTGSITVGNGYILLNNDKGIFSYNAPAEGETAATIELMKLRSNNTARLFYGTAAAGYSTLIYGNAIALSYGADGTNGLIITSSGLITIGTGSKSSFITEKLNVNGNIRTATSNGSYIQIGDIRLIYDSTNTAIKVEKSDGTAANFYATGSISALGSNSQQGGGGVGDVTWDLLASSSDTHQIALSHLTTALSGYITMTSADNRYLSLSGGTMNNTSVVTNLNADLLDGKHATGFMYTENASSQPSSYFDSLSQSGIYRLGGKVDGESDDDVRSLASNGNILNLHGSGDTAAQILFPYRTSKAYIRCGNPFKDNGYWRDWREIAFIDSTIANATTSESCTGNAASATQLANSYKINGTSFNGTSDITTDKWGTQRNVYISDSDATNTGAAVAVNGGSNVTLKLPSTIKASLTGNASTATKLADTTTTFTAWGRTFWSGGQPTNVSGALSNVTDITMSGDIKMDNNSHLNLKDSGGTYRTVLRLNSNNKLFFCQNTANAGYNTFIYGSSIYFRYGTNGTDGMTLYSDGTLGVTGATTVTGLLTANGNIQTGSSNGAYIKIGGLYIVYDSANTALKVSASATGNGAANLYATGAVSALGANTSSGGGSGDVFWSQLTTGTGGQKISATLLSDVTQPLYFLFNEDSNPSITYNGRANKTVSGILTKSYADGRYLSNGNISTITFSNGANNRVFSINNNGAVKLDVANVGASNGWETGYYVKSGSSYIGCLGFFGVGTALDYAFIGTGYNNTWLAVKSNGNVGIGTNNTNPSYKLHVNGTGYVSSNFYTDGYLTISSILQLHVASNNAYLTSNGNYFTISVGSANHAIIDYDWLVTSDMRRKDVIMNAGASIEQIADAPIFYYRLKDSPETTLTLGSSAQYWQQIFPNAVFETPDGFLSMNYSAIALASAVITARKVVDHEQRIRLLEVENQALRQEIEQLKKAA